jgi:hypothetical protein
MKQQNKNSGFQKQQLRQGVIGSKSQSDQHKWQAFSDESGNRTIQQQRQQQRQQESQYGPTRSQAGGLRAG